MTNGHRRRADAKGMKHVDPFERGEQLAKTVGAWIVASVETRVFWPKKPQAIEYNGREFLLLPARRSEPPGGVPVDQSPAIALRADAHRITSQDARVEISRFASVLAWQEGAKLDIVGWSGGNLPRQMGFLRNRGVSDFLDGEFLQVPQTETARAALAFYREGISLENPFYAFLSMYKAFSVAIPDGSRRGQWLRDHKDALKDRAATRLQEIEGEGHDIGDYVYTQGRNAIAHADREPFVNPDNTDDSFRLQRDFPVMEQFASMAIEEACGVKQLNTIWREHLFELEGFRALVPANALAVMRAGEGIPIDVRVTWPTAWLLRARGRPQNHDLPPMRLISAVWVESCLFLTFRSQSDLVEVKVTLDFEEERLIFDPLRALRVSRNRKVRTAIEEEIAVARFSFCIFCNGYLEIWDSGRDVRLGRSDVFIPVNMMVNPEGFKQQIAELESLLQSIDLAESVSEPTVVENSAVARSQPPR